MKRILRDLGPAVVLDTDSKVKIELYIGGRDQDRVRFEFTSGGLTPSKCRLSNYSYTRNLTVDCDLICTELESGRIDTFRVSNIIVGAIPVMLRSKACNLNGMNLQQLRDAGECPFDMGGYFVIGGKEKVYISQETSVPNRAMVEQGHGKLGKFTHQLRVLSLTLYVQKGQVFASSLALSEHVPVTILFAALGLVSDEQVCEAVGMTEPLRESLKLRSRTVESAFEYLTPLVKFKTLSAAVVFIHDQLLPQVKGLDAKGRLLSELVNKLLKSSLGQEETLDRDSFLNKRMKTSGRFMTEQCSDLFQKFWFNARSMVDREWNLVHKHNYQFPFMSNFVTPLNVGLIFDLTIVQGGLEKKFRNAEEIQDLSRISYAAYLSHMRRTSAPPLGDGSKVLGPHKLNSAQAFVLCPVDGPDGHKVGLVKTLAWTVRISGADGMATEDAISRVTNLLETGRDIRVYVNEVPCATMFLGPLSEVMKKLKANRDSFGKFACFSKKDVGIIHVRTDEGRLLRPLRNLSTGKWDMLDVEEVDTECYITMKAENSKNSKNPNNHFTHAEIHPACMLSVHASCIPFANHNQAARNVFSCSQGKQAIGLYATNVADRIDTAAYFLHYPQRPLVESAFSRMYPAGPFLNGGENLIVAVATMGGYNMEDAVLLNQGSVDRGMFNVTVMRSIFGDEESNFEEERAVQVYVDSKSLPEVNQLLHTGDIAVSRTKFIDERVKQSLDQFEGMAESTVTQKRENANIVVDKDADKSFVDRVYAKPGFCKVRVRKFRLPELGDKVCSRHGQKGVVGAVVPTVDMPYNAHGLTPDLIVNPHAFPSRMTVGQLLECLVAKAAVITGMPSVDATPFEPVLIHDVGSILMAKGFQKDGDEILYCPRTGEQIDTGIFIGPTYYLRLKHMVQDKINYRARGKLIALTGQPTQGRGNDGGIRMGEMERDVLIAHGTMAFLKESFVERSDGTRDFLLSESNGDLVGARPERKLVATEPSRISSVRVPESFKLLKQELGAFHIDMKLTA
jgi:DNA-directed RNA polymerase II subunit RPB2